MRILGNWPPESARFLRAPFAEVEPNTLQRHLPQSSALEACAPRLLIPQRHQRIDLRCATRRDIAASRATNANNPATAAKVSGSLDVTPKSKLEITRIKAYAGIALLRLLRIRLSTANVYAAFNSGKRNIRSACVKSYKVIVFTKYGRLCIRNVYLKLSRMTFNS